MVKNLPAMLETWVWSLGWEDTLEKEMATHSGILAWRIPWTEESGPWAHKELDTTEWLTHTHTEYMGLQRVGHNWVTHTHTHTHTHSIQLSDSRLDTVLWTPQPPDVESYVLPKLGDQKEQGRQPAENQGNTVTLLPPKFPKTYQLAGNFLTGGLWGTRLFCPACDPGRLAGSHSSLYFWSKRQIGQKHVIKS